MHIKANGDNALYELARTMTTSGHHSVATALRKLAQAGYTSLEQVEGTSDWILLSIPGIGTKRLGEVRRLSRSDWQPPSSQAIHAADRFLSAAQFALRYWPLELLISLIRGCAPAKAAGGPIEKQLALDVFSVATRKAQRHCEPSELIQTLWQAGSGHGENMHLFHKPFASSDTQSGALESGQFGTFALDLSIVLPEEDYAGRDSDHFAHPRQKRIEIVRRYWIARDKREIKNKDAWARSHYQISGKTLLEYEREFQDQRQAILATAGNGPWRS
jgi:hypothetical protein